MEFTNLNSKDRKQKRRTNMDLGSMVYGKVPPQAKDLEEAVLGAIMLEKSAFDTVIEILKPECFYVEAHQRIFAAMQGLANKSQPIDILTVAEELRFREELEMIGGAYYVTKLTNAVVSAANIEAHAQINTPPSSRLLDDLAAFQNVLFSSPRARKLSDAVRAGQVLRRA